MKEPEFIQDESFKLIIYRPFTSGEVTGEVTGEVKKVLMVIKGEMKRSEIQKLLQLKHNDYFRTQYILPALESGVIEMKYPDSPNHPNQKYKLTKKGFAIKSVL
ncbi:MAG: hypothetical protein L3J31_05530 [Bacteroidales bacterium]|nr:hypothetical protein [Bacteroidales bacterium]